MRIQIIYFAAFFLLNYSPFLWSQTKLSGHVIDVFTKLEIADVEIIEENSNVTFYCDHKGSFQILIPIEKGKLVLKKEGYYSRKLDFDGSMDFGTIFLSSESISLDEITLLTQSTIDKVQQIPIQYTPIQDFIKKTDQGDLIYGFKNIPSVYISAQGGGLGDGKMSIRGFEPSQTQIVINGIIVNDMETGWVYWSNWSGLTDLTTQVKMNSSPLGSTFVQNSFGGKIELNTLSEKHQTFSRIQSVFGNDGFLKNTFLHHFYDAKNNVQYRFLLGKNSSNGSIKGTASKSNTYYIDFQKKFEKHILKGFIMGSPQWHGQRSAYVYHMASLSDYLNYGIDYNYNFGYKNGIPTNWTENYFHKNLLQLQWKWHIKSNTSLETQIYTSFGTGGGSYESGNTPEGVFPSSPTWRNLSNGLVMWDNITAYNSGEVVSLSDGSWIQRNDQNSLFQYVNTPFNAGLSKIAFTNKHHWIGANFHFQKKIQDKLDLSFQYQFRFSHADNFDRISDLLGADAYMTFFDQNNVGNQYNTSYPINLLTAWNLLKKPASYDKLNFHYQSDIAWNALSGSASYQLMDWNFFTQYNFSLQQNKRTDFFNYLYTDSESTSDPVQQSGFAALVGVRYTQKNHSATIFSGWASQPNRFENLFINYKNDLNPQLNKENAFTIELNYQYKNPNSLFTLAFYNTFWKNKYTTLAYENPETHQSGTAFLSGVNQHHYGMESVFYKHWLPKWETQLALSIGNWEYNGNATGNAYDFSQSIIGSVDIPLKHVKVGNAAQFKTYVSLQYKPNSKSEIEVSEQYCGKLYSNLNLNTEGNPSIKLPNYFLTDLRFKKTLFQTYEVELSAYFDIQNLLNSQFISESATNYTLTDTIDSWKGIAVNNKVFFGLERTWQLGFDLNF